MALLGAGENLLGSKLGSVSAASVKTRKIPSSTVLMQLSDLSNIDEEAVSDSSKNDQKGPDQK